MPSLEIMNQHDSASRRSTTPQPSALAEFQSQRQAAQYREDCFQAWQHRWADAKDHLVKRLDAIDEQLTHLADGKRTLPKLTLVGNDFFNET